MNKEFYNLSFHERQVYLNKINKELEDEMKAYPEEKKRIDIDALNKESNNEIKTFKKKEKNIKKHFEEKGYTKKT